MESGLKCLSANLAMARRCSEISDLSKPCSIAGGYRNKFMCDRDRILYCKSFLRLAGKTQVYTPSQGDHQRTRLTHTLEVSQIARTIAKALDLDCDLTEAIALGHDIGHTPFGHAGERMLHEIMTPTNNEFSQVPKTTSLYTLKKSRQETLKQYYGFKHNLQSIRCLLDDLDSRDSKYGLNLTNYTLWGIMNHSGTSYKAGRVSTDYLIYNITTELYDKVAEIHNTNRLNVERNIRTVIENAYDRTPELLLEFFSYLPDS
jgi:dGTPase